MEFSKSRFLILALFYFLYIPDIFSETTQKKLNIAVAEFEARQVSVMDATTVSDLLRGALVNLQLFNITERKNMEKILKEQKLQLSDCTETSCAVEMGRVLAVKKLIIGNFGKLLDSYYINVKLVNVETAEIEYSNKKECRDFDSINTACREIAEEIHQKFGTK